MSYNPNNANGQATMANSSPVVIASDQSNINVANVAGTAIIGKVTTDQTTHGTTDLVAADITKVGGSALALNNTTMSASVPVTMASDQIPIQGIIYTGSTITRSANPTAYAAGQAVTAASGAQTTTCQMARANNQYSYILRCRMKKTTTTLTNAIFRVHLYSSQPTLTNGDNNTWLTASAGYVGFFEVTFTQAFSDGAWGTAGSYTGSAILQNTVLNQNYLYFTVEARAAYAPGNAEVFTTYLEIA